MHDFEEDLFDHNRLQFDQMNQNDQIEVSVY